MAKSLKLKLKGDGLLSGFKNPYLSKKPKFEIFQDEKEPINKYRWRIFMSSDEVAASSQGYVTRQLALQNAKSVMNHFIELDKEGKLI